LINASFSYSKPRTPNRFNCENRGAWYAALEVSTCLAEVKFHIVEELSNIGEFKTRVEYAEMYASFAGDFLDLRPSDGKHACLHPDPTIGYPAGNALAKEARSDGINLIVYPSVRDQGGVCFAALSPHVVQSVAQGGVWRMEWSGSPEPIVAMIAKAA
jgi:RES domain-containing protein